MFLGVLLAPFILPPLALANAEQLVTPYRYRMKIIVRTKEGKHRCSSSYGTNDPKYYREYVNEEVSDHYHRKGMFIWLDEGDTVEMEYHL